MKPGLCTTLCSNHSVDSVSAYLTASQVTRMSKQKSKSLVTFYIGL